MRTVMIYNEDGSVCRLSVKRVLYEKMPPVSTSSTNCIVVICSKKFKETSNVELVWLQWLQISLSV